MTEYAQFKALYDEIDVLLSHGVTASDPIFKGWQIKTGRFLAKKYGANSYEYNTFVKQRFTLGSYIIGATPRSDFVNACAKGLKATKVVFESYLDEMSEIEPPSKHERGVIKMDFSKVFIVHGHAGELKQATARLIEQQGIDAVILSEQVNQGQTLIEKFEANSNVCAAICLFTADDLGKAKDEAKTNNRARQNVVFEAGYFMGKLGREHVVLVADNGIEMPSDLQGVVYTNERNWQIDVLRELQSMGYSIDLNKAKF